MYINNHTQADNLTTLFINSVQCFPDRPALMVNNKYYTYQELYDQASNLSLAIKKNASVCCAVLTARNLTAYVAILAVLLSNKTCIPLNPTQPINRIVSMLTKANSTLLIADKDSMPVLKEILPLLTQPQCILLSAFSSIPDWTEIFMQKHIFIPVIYAQPNKELSLSQVNNHNSSTYLLFTSGSTGIPKGVLLTHANIISYVRAAVDRYKPNQYDKFSQVTDLTFDLSLHDIFVCWAVGACLYSYTGWDYLSLARFIKENELTFWLSVPSTAIMLLQAKALKHNSFSTLKVSLFCGEPLSHRVAYQWQQAAPHSIIENLYGPTEATIAFTAYRWHLSNFSDHTANEIIPIGKPFNRLSVKIIDEYANEVPADVVGEICLGGEQVVTGYVNDPELTTQKFIADMDADGNWQQWYKTGDLGLQREDGVLIYKGRSDDQWQVRGFRIEKLEIEIMLRKIAKTEAVAVIPYPQTSEGIILGLTVFVVDSLLTEQALWQACRCELPNYLIPNAIIHLNELPKNSRGKIDYQTLITLRDGVAAC